jgi:hypothetical protein
MYFYYVYCSLLFYYCLLLTRQLYRETASEGEDNKIMEDSDLKIHIADGFDDAARLAVANAEAYMKSASAQS